MFLLAAVLLLWGFTLDPTTADISDASQPALLAKPQYLEKPWANLTLICEARHPTKECQLILNGWFLNHVHLDIYVTSFKFPLGEITNNNRGLYRCRCGMEPPTSKLAELNRWTMLSNVVEVTGTEPLPKPVLWAEPVSWTTSGLGTYLLCQAALEGVTFLLRQEGENGFLKAIKGQYRGTAVFTIYKPGNYSCSYRTHETGEPSESSNIVTIKEYATPPPPNLCFLINYPEVKRKNTKEILGCRAPRNTAQFQLRRGDKVLNIHGFSPIRDVSLYHLKIKDLDGEGPLTCRYRLLRNSEIWSEDSNPIELMWTDEMLPAPVLTAEPSSQNLKPGSTVHFRCTAPKAGMHFGLQRQGESQFVLVQMLKPSGTEAVFELHNISTIDSGNYSCTYMEQVPPFSGSKSSEIMELRVNGPPPKPKLEALWKGMVPLGHEAHFRCHVHVPKVSVELVRTGFQLPFWVSSAMESTSVVLKLPFVGPQHAGNYSCRYSSLSPFSFESGISDPVEVVVDDDWIQSVDSPWKDQKTDRTLLLPLGG